jgi:hypothetical protein
MEVAWKTLVRHNAAGKSGAFFQRSLFINPLFLHLASLADATSAQPLKHLEKKPASSQKMDLAQI